MRLLYNLCNKRLLTYHIEHMWPMSEKVKKQIPIKKLIVKASSIEDYGWPIDNNSLLKQITKPNKESGFRH